MKCVSNRDFGSEAMNIVDKASAQVLDIIYRLDGSKGFDLKSANNAQKRDGSPDAPPRHLSLANYDDTAMKKQPKLPPNCTDAGATPATHQPQSHNCATNIHHNPTFFKFSTFTWQNP